MPLIFNGNEPKNITYNDNDVKKVIYNGNVVWEKSGGDINYIEYLSGDGEYLNTGIYPTQNTKIDFEVEMQSSSQYRGVIGCRNSNSFACFTGRLNRDTVWRFDRGVSQFNSWKKITVGEKVNIVIDKNKMYIDNTLYHKYPDIEFSVNQPIYIFAVNDKGSPYSTSQMKLYSCKIYHNDVLVGDFRPCLDTNNIECLYDEVSKQYFYKQRVGV